KLVTGVQTCALPISPLAEPTGEPGPIASYEAYFSRCCDAQPYAVEATPSYCYGGPRLVGGIRDTLEHPRIIIILRDPVDRLWSRSEERRVGKEGSGQ